MFLVLMEENKNRAYLGAKFYSSDLESSPPFVARKLPFEIALWSLLGFLVTFFSGFRRC